MKKRILAALLAISMLAGCAFGISACANNEKPTERVTAPVDETAEIIKSLQQQIAELQEQINILSDKNTADNSALLEQIKKLQELNRDLANRLDALEGKPVLDKEIETEIKNAYYNLNKKDFDNCNATADDILIQFYGEYYGSFAMFIHSIYDYTTEVICEIIDGIIFYYGSSQKLDVYFDGKFYSVSEAFSMGLLTHDNLAELADNLNNKSIKETEEMIKQDYYAQYNTEFKYDYFYGSFSDSKVFFICGDSAVLTKIIVADKIFEFNYDFTILVWQKGQFMNLQNAYDSGWLTYTDIEAIADIHSKIY